jgi:hypothetical protein
MTRSGITGSAFVTLLLGGLLLRAPVSMPAPQVAPPPAPSPTATVTADTGQEGQPEEPQEGPWKASQAHFAGIFTDSECRKKEESRWCIPKEARVQAMIALAPDPSHSHMALEFDRTVEAIQLAAQSMDYVADRYWLPWEVSAKSGWTDYNSLKQEAKHRETKEEQPGLLLFRSTEVEQSKERAQKDVTGGTKQPSPHSITAPVLYVFLVAETSTAGINGEEFRRAVDYVGQVCAQARGCGASAPVYIVGPHSSGSLDSLRELVEARDQTNPIDFIAYSGTVSSLCAQTNQHLLEDPFLLGQAGSLCREPLPQQGIAHLKFRSLANPTEIELKRFIELLQSDDDIKCHGRDGRAQVAILTEAATTYGSAIATGHDDGISGVISKDDSYICYTIFSYPREIANLRNAYPAADNQASPASSPQAGQRPYLSLNLEDQTNRSDEPPDFSGPQGPLSKEAVLMSFAAEMRRDHYRYIGISASNVLDALFLSGFLRRAVPDARLFIFNSDLLFERELDNIPYVGTLAITNYPLILRDLKWHDCKPGHSPLPFSEQVEEGEYNATVATMKEALHADHGGESYECGGSGGPCVRPPLWLTAVGMGGYWPVQIITSRSGESDGLCESRLVLRDEDFSTGWKAAFALLCTLAFLQIFVLRKANPLWRHFRDFAFPGAAPERRLVFINLGAASLASALALVTLPLVFYGTRFSNLPIIVATCAIAGLMIACYLRCARLASLVTDGPLPLNLRVAIFLCAFIWLLAFFLVLTWALLLENNFTAYGFFFAYRSVHLASQVSPLLPMLVVLAVFYLWSIFEIWHLRFNEQLRPRLKVRPPFPGSSLIGPSTEEKIARAVSGFPPAGSWPGLVATFGLWLFFFNPFHPFHLFEHPAFGRLYDVVLCAAVSLMLAEGFRLRQIWSELRGLLFEIERSPIRPAFGQLRGLGWSSIWRQWGEEVDRASLTRSLDAVQRLGSCDIAELLQAAWKPGAVEPDTQRRLKGILKALEKGADRVAMQSQLRALRFEAGRMAEQLREAPSLDRSRLLALQLEISAVVAALELPNAKAATEVEWSELRVGISQLCSQPAPEEIGMAMRRWSGLQNCFAYLLQLVLDILSFRWARPGAGRPEAEAQKEDSEDARNHKLAVPEPLEEYTALRYVAFIRPVVAHIRHSLIFLATSFSLVLISLNVYSFEPHRALIWSFTAIFAVLGFITVVVLMQVHRNSILSLITGTTPNELGLGFYVRAFSLGAVPLLTLLSTHFPVIGRGLQSFLQPGLEALK